MNEDGEGDGENLEAQYERRATDAIDRTKAAIVGTSRGVYNSLPGWLQAIVRIALFIGGCILFILILEILGDIFGFKV